MRIRFVSLAALLALGCHSPAPDQPTTQPTAAAATRESLLVTAERYRVQMELDHGKFLSDVRRVREWAAAEDKRNNNRETSDNVQRVIGAHRLEAAIQLANSPDLANTIPEAVKSCPVILDEIENGVGIDASKPRPITNERIEHALKQLRDKQAEIRIARGYMESRHLIPDWASIACLVEGEWSMRNDILQSYINRKYLEAAKAAEPKQ